jgi:hypothetical protein
VSDYLASCADLAGTPVGLAGLPRARTSLPEQPRNMRQLRHCVGVRYADVQGRFEPIHVDDVGLREHAHYGGVATAWSRVTLITGRAVEVGEAAAAVRAELASCGVALAALAEAVDGEFSYELTSLAAQAEAYAEALETIAAVPGVRRA